MNVNNKIYRWSGHVAFPGGKNEELETDEETCKREVWEEVGLDLNSDDFIQVGKLDEREIVSVASKKLLMMLIPFGKSIDVLRLQS
jgi:8-oxo-dGTP pyrophosphatase MutT (NUDIX family)